MDKEIGAVLEATGVAMVREKVVEVSDQVRVYRDESGAIHLRLLEHKDVPGWVDMWFGVRLSAEAARHISRLLLDPPLLQGREADFEGPRGRERSGSS